MCVWFLLLKLLLQIKLLQNLYFTSSQIVLHLVFLWILAIHYLLFSFIDIENRYSLTKQIWWIDLNVYYILMILKNREIYDGTQLAWFSSSRNTFLQRISQNRKAVEHLISRCPFFEKLYQKPWPEEANRKLALSIKLAEMRFLVKEEIGEAQKMNKTSI